MTRSHEQMAFFCIKVIRRDLKKLVRLLCEGCALTRRDVMAVLVHVHRMARNAEAWAQKMGVSLELRTAIMDLEALTVSPSVTKHVLTGEITKVLRVIPERFHTFEIGGVSILVI